MEKNIVNRPQIDRIMYEKVKISERAGSIRKKVLVRPKIRRDSLKFREKLGLTLKLFCIDPKQQENKTNHIGNVSKMGLGRE